MSWRVLRRVEREKKRKRRGGERVCEVSAFSQEPSVLQGVSLEIPPQGHVVSHCPTCCGAPDRNGSHAGQAHQLGSHQLVLPPTPRAIHFVSHTSLHAHLQILIPCRFFFSFFVVFPPLTLCVLSLMTHKGPTKPHQPFVFSPIRASERSPFQTSARQTVSKNNSCSFFILEPEPPRHSFCGGEHAAGHRVRVGPTSTMRQELTFDL